MADKNAGKKDDDKPKAEGISAKTALLADAVFGLFGHKVGDKVLDHLGALLTHTLQGDTDRPKHLVSFGEAFTRLRTADPLAYDIIDDFMRDELKSTEDRNDFQVRSAKMGGDDVDVTVDFLRLLASRPDHADRRELLDTLGLIGERAIDPMERVQKLAKRGWVAITTAASGIDISQAGSTIKAQIGTLGQSLTGKTDPAEQRQVVEDGAKARRDRSKDKLTAALAKLKK